MVVWITCVGEGRPVATEQCPQNFLCPLKNFLCNYRNENISPLKFILPSPNLKPGYGPGRRVSRLFWGRQPFSSAWSIKIRTFQRQNTCAKSSPESSWSEMKPGLSNPGVHNLFLIAGHITFIFMNCSRQRIQGVFISFNCLCSASTRWV